MKKNSTLPIIFFIAIISFKSFSQDTLIYEDFTGYVDTAGNYTVPSGWDISSNGSYTSSFVTSNSGQPAFQFNSSTDRITCPTFSGADSVKFWLKGASTDSLSSLTVLESSDSIVWDTLAFIVPLPTSSTYKKYFVKLTSKHLKFEYEKSAGNLAFDDFLLTGPEAITANFSAPDACLGDSTCFQDLSSTLQGTITSRAWNFGDGASTSSVQNPCHLYSSAGSYTVQLTIINSNSDTDVVTKTINVGSIPVSSFMPLNSSGCSPLTVNFMDMSTISTGTISTYIWDFGNGATSAASDTNIIFSNAGTFNITFIVTTDLGCKDTAYGTATVFSIPLIDTSGVTITSSNCGANDGSITGISVSGSSPFTYMWMPVMQTTLDITNVAGGNYSFTVTDSNSCSSSINLTINSAGAPGAPVISDTAVVYCDGDTIDSLFVTGTGGTITWYDDSLLTTIVATGTSYLPDLNLGDNDFYVTETTTCEGLANMVVITVNPTPTVSLNSSSTNICTGDNITFTASPSGMNNYNFFVNGLSIQSGSSNIYSANNISNSDTITVTAIDFGCSSQVSNAISITVNPFANATINPAGPFCESDSSVILTAVDSGGVWAGNGITNSSSGTFNPSVAGAGTHSIAYTISGNCGSSDTMVIVVNPNPVAEFWVSTNGNNLFFDTLIFNNSTTGAVQYYWDFGNGDSSLIQNPSVPVLCFFESNVTLTATSASGCFDTISHYIIEICQSISESFIDNYFLISPNPSKGKFTIHFSDTQQPATGIKVSNILGEVINNAQYSILNAQYSIDLSNQPEGTYFVTITSGKEIATKKIVVMR